MPGRATAPFFSKFNAFWIKKTEAQKQRPTMLHNRPISWLPYRRLRASLSNIWLGQSVILSSKPELFSRKVATRSTTQFCGMLSTPAVCVAYSAADTSTGKL